MAAEKKRGRKVETKIAQSLYQKFKSRCNKNNTSMAQVVRDAIQKYTK